MNKEAILSNLGEASEELERTIRELREDPEYGYGEFLVAMMHLYHHINTAWNVREVTAEEYDNLTDKNFYKWRSFPSDIDLS